MSSRDGRRLSPSGGPVVQLATLLADTIIRVNSSLLVPLLLNRNVSNSFASGFTAFGGV